MNTMTERRRKTELLKKEEVLTLRKYVGTFHTVTDASEALGMNQSTLTRILQLGKGSPENIQIIREKLNELQAA